LNLGELLALQFEIVCTRSNDLYEQKWPDWFAGQAKQAGVDLLALEKQVRAKEKEKAKVDPVVAETGKGKKGKPAKGVATL